MSGVRSKLRRLTYRQMMTRMKKVREFVNKEGHNNYFRRPDKLLSSATFSEVEHCFIMTPFPLPLDAAYSKSDLLDATQKQ